jgi:hypothetical protein
MNRRSSGTAFCATSIMSFICITCFQKYVHGLSSKNENVNITEESAREHFDTKKGDVLTTHSYFSKFPQQLFAEPLFISFYF